MGCSWDLSVKKAIANINADIHIRISPNTGIIAPIRSISPAVPNKPTLDLFETCFSER